MSLTATINAINTATRQLNRAGRWFEIDQDFPEMEDAAWDITTTTDNRTETITVWGAPINGIKHYRIQRSVNGAHVESFLVSERDETPADDTNSAKRRAVRARRAIAKLHPHFGWLSLPTAQTETIGGVTMTMTRR